MRNGSMYLYIFILFSILLICPLYGLHTTLMSVNCPYWQDNRLSAGYGSIIVQSRVNNRKIGATRPPQCVDSWTMRKQTNKYTIYHSSTWIIGGGGGGQKKRTSLSPFLQKIKFNTNVNQYTNQHLFSKTSIQCKN